VLAILFWAIARLLPGFRDKYLPKQPATQSEPVPAFVAPVGVPDAVVADAVVVAEPRVVAQAAAADTVDTVVIEQEPSGAAVEPEPESQPEPDPAPAAKARAAKRPAAKAPAAKRPAAKAAPAKATPAKATPAKATPAKKPAAASGEPKPKATRNRKPPASQSE
jgi:hypothetical protein